MPHPRPLGGFGLTTPRLVLGGNVFGWTIDQSASFEILDAFVARGGRMIDTANCYSVWAPGNQGGESETIIGQWLARRGGRDDVLIATKVGMKPDGPGALTAARIAAEADDSLKRLGTDYIDLYFAHRDDTATPLEETLSAFDRLVRAGKVRSIGASNYDAARMASALQISREAGLAQYTFLQPHYSLVARDQFEGALQELCVAQGIAVVPYYPLASGFLTGKYRTQSDIEGKPRQSSLEKHLNAFGLGVLAALDQVAADLLATPAQVALAWLAAQPSVAAPIASATSVAQLQELLGAMTMELSADHLRVLDAASRRPALTGPRP